MTTELEPQRTTDSEAQTQAAPAEVKPAPTADTGTQPKVQASKYTLDGSGLYLGNDENRKRICSPIKVDARTRDASNGSWGVVIKVQDLDSVWKRLVVPMSQVQGSPGELLKGLANSGLRMANQKAKTKEALIDYLVNAEVSRRVTCADRPGWHGGQYLLPYEGLRPDTGQENEEVVLQGAATTSSASIKGELSEWQRDIGRYLPGNSRLLMAVGASLSAPLLYVLGETESGGFHFFGGSSIGKTTALLVAGSLWGGGGVNGYLQNWRATANGLEAIAEAHCDAALCLDEIGQLSGNVAGEAAYMLANGKGKIRMNKHGDIQPVKEWRLLFISTGEITLVEKMAEANKTVRAGQITRLADIPADAGVGLGLFENLYDFESPGLLANHLKTKSMEQYGTVALAFLQRLVDVQHKFKPALIACIKEQTDQFMEDNVPPDSDGQVGRVAKRFALAAAAGELAVRFKVLDMPAGEITKGVATCFEAWLENRGGNGSMETSQIIGKVRHFIQKHQASRFPKEGEDPSHFRDLAGYRKEFTSGEHAGTKVFAVLSEVFKKEVCHGHSYKMVERILMDEGLLLVGGEGRAVKKMRISGELGRFYCIPSTILAGVGEEDDLEQDDLEPDDTLPVADWDF